MNPIVHIPHLPGETTEEAINAIREHDATVAVRVCPMLDDQGAAALGSAILGLILEAGGIYQSPNWLVSHSHAHISDIARRMKPDAAIIVGMDMAPNSSDNPAFLWIDPAGKLERSKLSARLEEANARHEVFSKAQVMSLLASLYPPEAFSVVNARLFAKPRVIPALPATNAIELRAPSLAEQASNFRSSLDRKSVV